MQSLDFRGLGRWNFIPLLACLVLGSTVAAFAMGMAAISVLTFGVGAIATAGMIATGAMILGPVLGCLGGVWGALRSKSKALHALRAQQLPPTHPLSQLTNHLAGKISLPAPEVYFYDDPSVNAFATGAFAGNSAVVLSRGLLEKVSHQELVAIIGHELGHIASGDIWKMNFANSFQNSIVCLFRMFGLGGFAKWAFAFFGEAAIMALSRRREYWADAIGTVLGGPEAMASALRTVHDAPSGTGRRTKRLHRSMLHWRGGGFLMSSHPTLGQRLSAIEGGYFARRSLAKLGQAAQGTQESDNAQAWFPDLWSSISDLAGLRRMYGVGALAGGAIVAIIGIGYTALSREEPVLIAEPAVVPRVAAWEQRVEPSPVVPPKMERSPDEQAKREHFRTIEQELTRKIEEIERKRYPKEVRYEPDETLGDPELTPYQLLVEHGNVCVYQANQGKEFIHQHMEDSGPDKSDLLVYLLDPTEPNGARRLASAGEKIKQCWKSVGGSAVAMGQDPAVTQAYDVWVLKDAESGATAECGMWKTVRAAKKGRVAIAAYCR